MHYFDTRLSKALMENVREDAQAAVRGTSAGQRLNAIKEQIGVWMIRLGEKLTTATPKAA